ncbi:FAD-binding protein [Klebsiella pneumoniae subsp. pneumoniae]|nr:FAD-binding protein [Klebsiella pneumoniae subsp. pneumoniae]
METRDKVSAAIIALPEHYAYIVFDEHVRAKNKAADVVHRQRLRHQRQLTAGTGGETGDGLPCLPRHPSSAITGRWKNSMMNSLAGPPRYARRLTKARSTLFRIAPGVHHTMGGVTINTDGEVLNVAQQPISRRLRRR